MFTVALDAMGGDHAPGEIVAGAVEAARRSPGTQILLVGPKQAVETCLADLRWQGDGICVVDAPDVIEMAESPVEALARKPFSSIARAIGLVKEGKAQALVSGGNTGAVVAGCFRLLGYLPRVRRPGIAVTLWCTRPVILIDAGASLKCTAEILLQYALMGQVYAEEIYGIRAPRVGLLNVGEEDAKGGPLVREANALFHESGVNYVGNVEGVGIFDGTCDIVICDGFVGNIVLKVCEGLAENVFHIFKKDLAGAGVFDGELDRLHQALTSFRERIDYAEQGGAPLLGIDGVCIVCHGRSHGRAISNAVRMARRLAESPLARRISERLSPLSAPTIQGP